MEGERILAKRMVEDGPVRWCAALLCGMGEDWNVAKTRLNNKIEMLESFYSSYLADVRSILQFVTWNTGEQNAHMELFSIGRLSDTYFVNLNGDMSTAYGSDIRAYNITEPVTAKSYKFEFDALVSSYPSNNDDYEPENRQILLWNLCIPYCWRNIWVSRN